MIRAGLLACFLSILSIPVCRAQTSAAAEAEADKCLDRIASVRREILGRYDDGLRELQNQFQKSADLEAALSVRAERERLDKEKTLSEKQFVEEPRALRLQQQQTLAKLNELISALVNESIPKLVEIKKALTIAGSLDEAVKVRGLIAKLQDDHLRVERPGNGELVSAETLTQAYAADRARADKTYKGTRLVVKGAVGTVRTDPADAQRFIVYLTKSGNNAVSGGWVACIFNSPTMRFREEKNFNTTTFIVTERNEILARFQAGQMLEIQGTCDGFEELVRLNKCEFVR